MSIITTQLFIEKARKVHRSKYDYSKVEYVRSSDKIIIICPKHGEFKQSPGNHLAGKGCKKCGFISMWSKRLTKMTTEKFIREATNIHGNKYDYSKVKYVNASTQVIVICPIHGEIEQYPHNHLKGCECKKCKWEQRGLNDRQTTEKFVKRANQLHNDRYDYSKVKYTTNYNKVTIICIKHGEFIQAPIKHLSGRGCPECAWDKRKEALKLNKEEFTFRANKIHNNKYDYSKIEYINMNKKIIIVCPEHGEFQQTPNNHLAGKECPKCHHRISKVSSKWLEELKITNREVLITLKDNKKIFVDGFDKDTNTVYEFYGDYWHGNPKIFDHKKINPSVKRSYGTLYSGTISRAKKIINNGYSLIYKWETDYNMGVGKKYDKEK